MVSGAIEIKPDHTVKTGYKKARACRQGFLKSVEPLADELKPKT